MKKLGRFHKLFLLLNVAFVLLLLCSYLGAFISPKSFWPLAFFPLLYPYLIIANIAFILFWAIQLKRLAFLSLFTILLGWSNLGKLFQFGNQKIEINEKNREQYLKVMSFNVRVFDLYNWKHNTETRNKIIDYIRSENPDIINFQEFFTDDGKSFLHEDSLKKMLNLPYAHIYYTSTLHQTDHWGMATYSRFPILSKDKLLFSKKSSNLCIYSDIKVKDKIFRVYNLHLQSLHFKKKEYKVINDLKGNEEVDFDSDEMNASRMILARLKRAFVKRATQADTIAAALSRSPHAAIVCGDFNDSPFSYAYATISKELKDAFIEAGNGFGPTYNGNLPPLRIDYILYSKDLEVTNFKTSPVDLSDHFPISCYVKLH